MKCDVCENASKCLDHMEIPNIDGCTSGIPSRKVPANADKIRTMTDKELAETLSMWDSSMDKDEWLEWLQSEAE